MVVELGEAFVFGVRELEGLPCTQGSECKSGYCADGVCCNSPCGNSDLNDCMACSVARGSSWDGFCGPIVDGTPCTTGTCLAGACISPTGSGGGGAGAGGIAGAGGGGAAGGAGGFGGQAGAAATGGLGGVGGFGGSGGFGGTGGVGGQGGTSATGGDGGQGGTSATGGAAGQGGTSATGGAAGQGGTSATGGAAGQGGTGGTASTGGSGGSGGAAGHGGTGGGNLGSPCQYHTECSSNFCVNGYCCDSACNGQCEACDVAPNFGICSPVTGPSHDEQNPCVWEEPVCGGSCDGINRDTCSYPSGTTVCGTSCTGGQEVQSLCDGQGHCVTQNPVDCSPYLCVGNVCATACNADEDCADGYRCEDETCVPVGDTTCLDGTTKQNADGSTTACTPYRCRNGECLELCHSVDDCALSYICDAQGVCRPAGSADTEGSGCGCRLRSVENVNSIHWLWLLAAFSVVGRARRRC